MIRTLLINELSRTNTPYTHELWINFVDPEPRAKELIVQDVGVPYSVVTVQNTKQKRLPAHIREDVSGYGSHFSVWCFDQAGNLLCVGHYSV